MTREQKQGCDHGDKSAKPGKAGAEPIEELLGPVNIRQSIHELSRVLQLVVKLGAKHASQCSPQDDVVGNIGQATTASIGSQNQVGGHEGQPHENTESAQIQWSEMDVREQRKKYTRADFGLSCAGQATV